MDTRKSDVDAWIGSWPSWERQAAIGILSAELSRPTTAVPSQTTGGTPTCAGCGWLMTGWNSVRGWYCMNVSCSANKVQEDCPHCKGTGKVKK